MIQNTKKKLFFAFHKERLFRITRGDLKNGSPHIFKETTRYFFYIVHLGDHQKFFNVFLSKSFKKMFKK